MKLLPTTSALAAASLLATAAFAQQSGPSGALERFSPSVPGDALFGVPSPSIGGHLVPRATVAFDYAYGPLSIDVGGRRAFIVSRQGFLHAGASFALFDRAMISADMPFALVQDGESPTVGGTTFTSPSGAQVGDLRVGARARVLGGEQDPLQLGVGAYAFVPTAPKGSYAGDGAVRGEPQLLLGGRLTHFVWSFSASAMLRASSHPHSVNIAGGGAYVTADDFFQIGPEITFAIPFSKDTTLSTATTQVDLATSSSAEVLMGAKLRPLPPLVFGVGAGPGLTHGWGTPVFFAVGTIGYDPRPPRGHDQDGDGISDEEDACPALRGVQSADLKVNGCPPDRDRDGIADGDDACPDQRGDKSADASKNGCPSSTDRDGDGIADADDACPDQKGEKSAEAGKNGCPSSADRDGDGIADFEDACPDVKGEKSGVACKNGCPADRDGDGIADANDACPDQSGPASQDPKLNGCPDVRVTSTEILTSRPIRFIFNRYSITQVIDPLSEGLLEEVRKAIVDHPEIEVIEIHGHADSVGLETYNQSLSRKRAEAVRDWLVERGIPASKLRAMGFGSSSPVASNSTDPGRQENRRVTFVIVKKMPQ
ncbi:MAG: OmpA family protein [Byssovorax sp.]